MEWHHPQSPQKKKIKKSPSVSIVMITVFWDCEGEILLAAMLKGETTELCSLNQDADRTLEAFQMWPQEPTEILFQHVNAWLHNSLMTLEAIIKFDVTVLRQLPYSPDLALTLPPIWSCEDCNPEYQA
jgi:hypothetical protein